MYNHNIPRPRYTALKRYSKTTEGLLNSTTIIGVIADLGYLF